MANRDDLKATFEKTDKWSEVAVFKGILHEGFAQLLADVNRIIHRATSEEGRRQLEVLHDKICIIWNDIFGNKYSTMEDIYELKGQFRFIKSYLEALKHASADVNETYQKR